MRFWDYNLATFLPSLSFLQIFSYTHPGLLQSNGLFLLLLLLLLIFIACIFVHMHIYSKYDLSVCMFLPVCMLSVLTIWQPIGVLFPGVKLQLPFPHFFSYLCVGLKSYRFFSIQFGMLIGLVLVQLTFGQSYWWNFMHIDSDVTRIQKSHSKLPDP